VKITTAVTEKGAILGRSALGAVNAVSDAIQTKFGDIAEHCRPGCADFNNLSTLPSSVGYKLDICREIAESINAPHIIFPIENVIKEAADLYRILFVGRYNTGKSSVLNCILGRNILPTGGVPTTKALTWIAGGDEDAAWYTNERGEVTYIADEYAGEQGETKARFSLTGLQSVMKDENKKGRTIFISLNHPLLRSHVAIIDTPGLEDPDENNPAITWDSINDANSLVFVTDNLPLSAKEKHFLEELVKRDKVRDLFLIFNKMDVVPDHEREEFLQEQIKVLNAIGISAHLYPVSTRKPETMMQFVSDLGDFIKKGVIEARNASAERKVNRLLDDTRNTLLCYSRNHADAAQRLRGQISEAEQRCENIKQKISTKIDNKERAVMTNWKFFLNNIRNDINVKIDSAAASDLKRRDFIENFVLKNVFEFLSKEMKQVSDEINEALKTELDGFPSIFVEDGFDLGLGKSQGILKIPPKLVTAGFVVAEYSMFGLLAGIRSMVFVYFAGPLLEGFFTALSEHLEVSALRKKLREALDEQWPKLDSCVREKIREFFTYFREEIQKKLRNAPDISRTGELLAIVDGLEHNAPSPGKLEEWLHRLKEVRDVKLGS
jgi:ribosome biogenesis GTPase A